MRRLRVLGLLLGLAGCVSPPEAQPVQGLVHLAAPLHEASSVPLTLDAGRAFVTLHFHLPGGRVRPALASVNMGMGGISLTPTLRAELGTGAVEFDIGDADVRVEPAAVLAAKSEDFAQQFGPMPVEATLPAGVLRLFRVTLDEQARRLTLAPPADAPAPGIAVPIEVSPATGIAAAVALVDGKPYPVVIDSGAGYSWWRGEAVRELIAQHKDWLRAEFAVGASNQAMLDRSFEQEGSVIRIPALGLGSLQLRDVGVLGSGPAHGGLLARQVGGEFWDAWAKGAPGPVVGWLGGNVLASYRVTMDYRNGVSYWQPTAAPVTEELNAVGISLVHEPGGYRIGNIGERDGASLLPEARRGDGLREIDGRATKNMSRGEIEQALRGKPGTQHYLTLDRDGAVIQLTGVVQAF